MIGMSSLDMVYVGPGSVPGEGVGNKIYDLKCNYGGCNLHKNGSQSGNPCVLPFEHVHGHYPQVS